MLTWDGGVNDRNLDDTLLKLGWFYTNSAPFNVTCSLIV